ncbi:MAG: 2-C-methyl-D-erythritol 4-phosphate cytidylyltransferase [Ginsengibacter sp.]
MKKVALIVAAGNGSRMNRETPKQFLLLKHKPVLYYTIQSFLDTYEDMEIILVLPEDYIANGQEIVDGFFDTSKVRICAGGRTRFHSVQNGLKLVEDESIIFVHDGVRCLVSPELIRNCYEHALEKGTAIPVISCTESVRLVNETVSTVIDRNTIKLVQTPQTFHSKLLIPAFNIDYKDQFIDEATVMEAFGLNVHLIDGEKNNIKITTEMDLYLAEKIIEVSEEVDA